MCFCWILGLYVMAFVAEIVLLSYIFIGQIDTKVSMYSLCNSPKCNKFQITYSKNEDYLT